MREFDEIYKEICDECEIEMEKERKEEIKKKKSF